MEPKNIELELRAEINHIKYKDLINSLERIGRLSSSTERLSVMYFGEANGNPVDIRVRITNGNAEVVLKSGQFGAADRTEVSQPIQRAQFLGMVKLFSGLRFKIEVGERKTVNFVVEDDIVLSLISAGNISYLELECMSTENQVKSNENRLREIARRLDIRLLESDAEFDNLCDRLSKTVDWPYTDSYMDHAKLEKLFNVHKKKYASDI
ncbi:MAG: CYTH domain-containing protein [Patescibacteria group bacterium]|nr:CYTH domain-containing protein [Patescibacteria group bacterium]